VLNTSDGGLLDLSGRRTVWRSHIAQDSPTEFCLSTVVRVLYFLAIVLLLSTCVFYVRHHYLFGLETSWSAEFQRVSDDLMVLWKQTDKHYFKAAFLGLWIGAAVHTVVDVAVSIVKLLWKAI
jgi:uncharacterized metal-binding protein